MKPCVLIESPFGTDAEGNRVDAETFKRNQAYAVRAVNDSLRRGEAPFASHVLYPLVLDDATPEERKMGMESGFAWGAKADRVAVYVDLGVSSGMAEGIERWNKAGLECEPRTIGVEGSTNGWVIAMIEHVKRKPSDLVLDVETNTGRKTNTVVFVGGEEGEEETEIIISQSPNYTCFKISDAPKVIEWLQSVVDWKGV